MRFYVEDNLEQGLKDCYRNDLWEAVSDPMEAVQRSGSLEDVLMNIAATHEEIYYAFLKDALHGENYFNKSESEETRLNFTIAQNMLHKNMDYQSIIYCMSYAPMFSYLDDFKKRWDEAVSLTCLAINPVLSFSDVVHARPLALLDIDTDSPSDIYIGCVKTILYKMPSLTLQSVDEETVKILINAGCREDDSLIRDVISESLNFNFAIPDDPVKRHEQYLEVSKMKDDFLKNAIAKAKEEKPTVKKMSDQEIYDEMQKKIRSMKEEHEKGDGFHYWQTAIGIIKDTMSRLQNLHSMSRTLNIWSVGLEHAAKELSLDVNPDKDLQNNISELLQSIQDVKKEKTNWAAFWPLLAKVELYSRELLQKLDEVQHRNPLLKISDVQHAEPLNEVIGRETVTPHTLYFAALKDVVIKNPGVTQDEADNMIIKKLLSAKRNEDDVMLAISYSPCFKNLTRVQAMGAAQRMADNIQQGREQDYIEKGAGGR